MGIITRLRAGGVGALLARGAMAAFAINVVGLAISLLVQIGLARMVSLAAYGVYVYVTSWLTLLLLPAKLGLDNSILRYAAIYTVEAEWACLRGLLRRSRQIVFSASMVVGLLVVLALNSPGVHHSRDMEQAFVVACVSLPILALTAINVAALRGLLHTVWAQFSDAILRPLVLILLALAVIQLLDAEMTGSRVVALYGVASLVTLLVSWVLVSAKFPESPPELVEYRTHSWLAVALPLMLLSGFQVAMNQLDTVMVGAMLGPESAGIYSVAARVAMFVLFGLNAVNVIIAPIISSLYAKGDNTEIQRLMNLSGVGLLVFSLPVASLLVFFGPTILGLFGDEFMAGYSVLTVLCVAQLVNALSGSVGYLMTMTGHQRQAGWILAGGVVINAGLNWVLIPHFGIEGAAVGTAIAIVFWNLLLALMVWKCLRVNTYAFLFQLPSLLER